MASTNFINGNDVATLILDTEAPYNILDFDQGLCVMTGYSPREISKKICTLDNLLYVEDFSESIASVNYQLSISNLVSIQYRIVTKSGTILTVLCNGQAFTLNDGRDVLQCVFTDITNLETAASQSAQAKTDLEIFANTVPSGVSKHLLDNKLSLTWANNYFFSLSGYSQSEFKDKFGTNTLALVHSEDLSIVIDALADLTDNQQSTIISFRISCASDIIKWVNAIFARAGETHEGFPVVNLVMTDITNLKIAEMKATLEEQKYLIISDISEELPYEYDIAEDVITFAEKFSHIFEGDAIITKPGINIVKEALVSYDTANAIEELFESAKQGLDYFSAEFKLNTRNGGYQWYFTTFSSIKDENGTPIRVVGLLRNIHAQKIEQQNLLFKAETDSMTGLLNKATTESKIKQYLRQLNGNAYGVLMLVDIDDFKNVNDTFGHLKGDEVIIAIADALKEFTGPNDFAGRIGGDEFCVFYCDILDTQVACEKAVEIADRLRSQYPGDNGDCKVTLSIGIASTNDQIPYSVLLENSDTALYDAKLNGKNGYTFYDDNMERSKYENARTSPKDDSLSTKIVHELLTTLYNDSNYYEAIERTISLIGNSFNLDKINIWEFGFNKSFINCTHQWNSDGIKNTKKACQHTPANLLEELDSLSTDGVMYTSDMDSLILSSSKVTPATENTKQYIQSKIEFNNNSLGYISFASSDNSSLWNVALISNFKILFKIIAEAICNKHSQTALTTLREDTINAFDNVQNSMIVIDKDSHNIMYFNQAAKESYPDISLNNKCYSALQCATSPCTDCTIHKLNDSTSVKVTKKLYNSDEPLDVYTSPIKWSNSSNSFLLSISDHKQTKSERIKQEIDNTIIMEKRIEEASYKDIITGYPNFEKFKITGQEILNNNADIDFAMFYFNIKNFKFINETYGHATGDRTLKCVADVLAKFSNEDEAFARVISDTYIMIINNSDTSFMRRFEIIRNEVKEACRTIQDKFAVDLITGILIIDDTMHSYPIGRLIDRAIMAAKSIDPTKGVSYSFYDDEYHKKILNEAQIENSMHSALANKEFCAYVQPKYDIDSKQLVSGELLVRWISPSKGFLEPAAFLPSFESNGFIFSIDLFMLEEACKSLRKYLDNDIHVLPFSVNLSRITLMNEDFIESIQNIVDSYYIPHHYIELEITEGVFVENYEQILTVLNQLKDMDFIINMDDFGTGYSSLTLLKDLPIDVIKLDKNFIHNSNNEKNTKCILKSIIDMAHALDIKIVSEGIETEEQLEMLRGINCEVGQGFLFAKPMPIEDYDSLVKNHLQN